MSQYIRYVLATGEITGLVTCPESMRDLQAGPGESVMDGVANDLTQYIVGGAVQDRPPWPGSIDALTVPANGTDMVTISGLPNPTDVVITGPTVEVFQVTDGALELTFDSPGAYKVRLTSFPHLGQEYVIDAT